jgi:NAD(P)-dependent dehydrogenase (short-subunit alcohol dehydrogenase family)
MTTAEKKKSKRVALVTGANRGLGFDTCRQLAQLGLTVILSARGVTKGEAAAKQLIERGLVVIFYELGVSNQSHISRIAHQIEQRFGRLDVLVNNAAILYDTWQNADNADLNVVNQALTTLLLSFITDRVLEYIWYPLLDIKLQELFHHQSHIHFH